MTDLPKLPGGWVWAGVEYYDHARTQWIAEVFHKDGPSRMKCVQPTRAEAIARVAAMVEAVVGSENKESTT